MDEAIFAHRRGGGRYSSSAGRRAADAREIGHQRLTASAAGQVRLEGGEPGVRRIRVVRGPRAIHVFIEHVVVQFAAHWLSIARSFMRALCTCDFDVPSETPRIFATSRCSNPSTSCRRNAARYPSGKAAIARSRSTRLTGRRHDRRVRRRLERVLHIQRLCRAAHLRAPTPQMIEAMVHRQAVQPGAERRFPAKSGQFPMCLEKHLLQQILRILGGARHPEHQAEQAPGVLAIQLLERVGVPGPASRRQLQVGGSHVSWQFRRELGASAEPSCPECFLYFAVLEEGTG